MRNLVLILACAGMIFAGTAAKAQNDMTKQEKASYALGANYGEQFRNLGISVDMDLLVKGIKDAMAGENQFDQAQMQEAFSYVDEMVKESQARMLKE